MTQALSQLRTRRRRLAWLVLPALLLRGLIPFGFMPVAGGAGLTIGFCPGEGALPPAVAAHYHEHHGGHHGDPGAAHHAPCLFASGAAAAVASAASAPVIAPALPVLGEATSLPVFLPAIRRAQSPRGPPLLA